MRKVALGVKDFYGGTSAEVGLEVGDDGERHGDIARGLDYAAGHAHEPQHAAEIGIEHRSGDKERDVRPHVEQSPAELSHCCRYVGADGERRESPHPCLVVRLHRHEHPFGIPVLEPAMIIPIVQKSRRGADEDELKEKLGTTDGGQDADHGRDGMADKEAAVYAEGFEDDEEVVDVGI